MSCGIYKITNQINGKVYIGQSIDISRRWKRHLSDSKTKDYPIYRAIRKHGIENFSFEILEECLPTELNKKEKYWIETLKTSFLDKGYNLTLGGHSATSQSLLVEDVLQITSLLQTSTLTNQEIADLFEVSENTISGINTGYYWRRDLSYPIREKNKRELNFCKCGVEISPVSKECTSCYAL